MRHFVFSFLLLAGIGGNGQMPDSGVIKAYLRNQTQILDTSLDPKKAIFTKDLYTNRMFLFGENHGAAEPQAADLYLFKNLYYRAGVRYYLAELDCTKAWMLNEYLDSGDEHWLQRIFQSWKKDTAQWNNQSLYQKFVHLRAFYQQLPANKRFRVLGIDVPQDYSLLADYQRTLLKNVQTGNWQPLIDSLNKIADTTIYENRKALIGFVKRLTKQAAERSEDFKRTFGPGFRHYITSISFLLSGMSRDSIMFRNLKDIIAEFNLRDARIYGFLGYFHCLQTSYERARPFAALLRADSSLFSGKMISFQMMVLDGYTMLPYSSQAQRMIPAAMADKMREKDTRFRKSDPYLPFNMSYDGQMLRVSGIDLLRNISTPNATYLVRLDAPGSPFYKSDFLADVNGFQPLRRTDKTAPTTAAFQYIILFRNCKAALPLD